MVKSVGLEGLKGYCIDIEADVRTDKEACIIIGLPNLSMKESRERILSNLYRLNFDLSLKCMTVQLSPPDKRKVGIGYDCAMVTSYFRAINAEQNQN